MINLVIDMDDRLTITERMLKIGEQSNPVIIARKKIIMEIFNKMVIVANQEVNIPEFKKIYFPDEDRTLELIIEGMEDLDTGFVIQDSKFRTIKKLKDTPTATFKCSEETYLRLATDEVTFAQCYFWGWMDISGEFALRDYEILKRMFNKYKYIFKKIRNGM
jgi:hypothetical protein